MQKAVLKTAAQWLPLAFAIVLMCAPAVLPAHAKAASSPPFTIVLHAADDLTPQDEQFISAIPAPADWGGTVVLTTGAYGYPRGAYWYPTNSPRDYTASFFDWSEINNNTAWFQTGRNGRTYRFLLGPCDTVYFPPPPRTPRRMRDDYA